MISDSIANASILMASSNPKDFSKKKKANRSAKLKQCKLDARREQWLSQVKNKGNCKEEPNGGGIHGGSSVLMENESIRGSSVLMENESIRAIEKLEIKPREVQENYGDGLQLHHYSDSESSPSNSPTSHTSSVLGSSDSRANFTGSGSSSSSSRSSSGSSNGCCSGSMSEEDEGDDDGCLDDWEAMADALAATDDKQPQNPDSGLDSSPSQKDASASQSDSRSKVTNQSAFGLDISKPKRENQGMVADRALVNCQAWRPDDACRPQTLPNLSKQYSFPMNSGRHFGCGGSVWACKNVGHVPTSCPICYEDFDFTDSSFLPCSCGFRLCLFCHKRILEEDGRCPGCRKQYDSDTIDAEATQDGGSLTFRLARSFSMVTRS
ncbi:TPRXL isoform X1 [Olea europaea subsp. europaea]|uniref:TPRXL isoform X1 n=1 Tax=Olea europaea subsp. europaea TaxID=158383 RepID=A0A8S0Q1R0_OLEEU|nr:TPRXL isoform X1 [Olea europaea subsp. europaea]